MRRRIITQSAKNLEMLVEVGQRLTQNLTSDTLLQDVTEEFRKATEADIVTLYPYLPSEERLGQPIYHGQLLRPEVLGMPVDTERADNIARLTLNKGEPVWAKNSKTLYAEVGGDPSIRAGDFELRERIRSTAALSLQIDNEPIGVMFVNFRKRQPFRALQQNLIEGLANYAAVAIKNYRKYADLNERHYQNLIVVQRIAREMRVTPGLNAIMSAILEAAVSRVKDANESAIILYNRRTGELETAASKGTNSGAYQTLTLPVKGSRGLTVWVYNHKQSVRIDNVKDDPQWREAYYPVIESTVSEMDIPLIDDDEVVGIISFESPKEKAFTKEDQDFVETLAEQAVLAIRHAQFYEEAVFARKELESLEEIVRRIINRRHDPKEVMTFILQQARVLLKAEFGAVQLYDGLRPGKVYLSEEDDENGNPIVKILDTEKGDPPVVLGIVKHVAETQKWYLTEGDAVDDEWYIGSPDFHSEIAVPLISSDDELIGVLDLESPRLSAFNPWDVIMLDLFAGQAVVAMQYAQAYRLAVSESERFRLLSEAGRDLGELTDMTQRGEGYNIVVDKLSEFSDGEIVLRRYDEIKQRLVLEAVRNPRPIAPPKSISVYTGINGRVAREHRTIIITDLWNPPDDMGESVDDDPSIRTLAVTPIQFQETRYYGNLVLSHPNPSAVSSSDETLLAGLAQQLAITIHRLEAEQQTRDLALLAEVGHSGLSIAHRLSSELGWVHSYVSKIRLALPVAQLENPAVSDHLEKIVNDVTNVLNISKDLKKKVGNIGREVKQPRITVAVSELLYPLRSEVIAPEHIDIHWSLPDDLGYANVVPSHILDMMRSLITNAIEAIEVEGRITIRAFVSAASVWIEVEDNGKGIEPEHWDQIFGLLFSTKGSSGFGLWSASLYARANSGRLIPQSEPGIGTTFALVIPAVQPKPSTVGISAGMNEGTGTMNRQS